MSASNPGVVGSGSAEAKWMVVLSPELEEYPSRSAMVRVASAGFE